VIKAAVLGLVNQVCGGRKEQARGIEEAALGRLRDMRSRRDRPPLVQRATQDDLLEKLRNRSRDQRATAKSLRQSREHWIAANPAPPALVPLPPREPAGWPASV